jgi:hypothetical protein
MAKYMILYNSTLSAEELMANASPEEMKASMEEWMQWKDKASKTVGFDFGMPLSAVSRVTSDGAGDSDSKTSGYSIMEGDSKDAIIELLRSHPHLKRTGASIDVFEMLSMPGM